jgi:hypothetical protein
MSFDDPVPFFDSGVFDSGNKDFAGVIKYFNFNKRDELFRGFHNPLPEHFSGLPASNKQRGKQVQDS